jgi:hypothetical protein
MRGNRDSFDDADREDQGFRDDEPARVEDDREHCVANRPNPLPGREQDEEELAEADILEELDLDDLDDSDMFDRE